MGSRVIDRDRVFYEWWKEEYSLFRPDEPDETKGEEESAWKKLLEYAEDNLKSAFDAGYEACKEDVSNL